MRGRFIGRTRELDEVEALIAAVHRDGPRAGLVIGAPGSGKSRLLAEAAVRSDVRVLKVRGHEPEQGVPLTATRDLLRELSRSPREGTRLYAIAFGEQPWGRAEAPLRLFEATYRCAAELAPAVITIDDLQWIDDVSAALVTYLARAACADGESLAVLAASRPSARAGAMRDALDAILPSGALVDIELGPLPAGEGVALVRELVTGIDAPGARRIWERPCFEQSQRWVARRSPWSWPPPCHGRPSGLRRHCVS